VRKAAVKEKKNVSITIVNGKRAKPCAWPWQVTFSGACGGTIIGAEWVLTAAHCGKHATPGKGISAGFVNWNSPGQFFQRTTVARSFPHPNYNSSTYRNDIMLVRVTSRFRFNQCVKSARLPTRDARTRDKFAITGWGRLSDGGPVSDHLMEAKVRVWSQSDCRHAYRTRAVSDDMVCANEKRNGKVTDACQGDSGGPLATSKGVVYGVTSWGVGCAQANRPGVWSRVHKADAWIRGTMRQR